jgi:general secretion pathway protein J
MLIEKKGNRGFTLLEMIVTMTILGFILLIIFSAFRLGLSVWEKGESKREDYQKIRTVSQLVSRQVKSIVPYKIKTQKAEGDYLAFEGKSRSLKFVSALPIQAKRLEGFVSALYEFKEGGSEGGRFVLYEKRVLNKDFFEETPKEESGVSLFEGVSNVQFEYYREGNPEKNRTEGWVEEWNAKDEKELPSALRLTITYKNGKNQREEAPFTLLVSIPAHRFEEIKTGTAGFGRRAIRQMFEKGGI